MMAIPDTQPAEPSPRQPGADWGSFYANFRKPGYVPGFEIGHKLGGGVFGVVYKARRESIGKAYAIKFLRVEDPGVRGQVLAEIETVSLFAQVDHPNLVSIEDKGVVDGIPFIVMGYAGDETLRTRLEERRLNDEEALRLFVQVARGVNELHEHSLVHFDLKPANIFLKGDVARVGDFGLSKLLTQSAMSLTMGRGTPHYMAPEMLRRKGDQRSDIYSLGVILYECLTGRVPFTGDSEWEVLKGHEEKPVEYPAEMAPRHRALLERMLAKDPADRYATLSEVLDDLRAGVVPDVPPRTSQKAFSATATARTTPPRRGAYEPWHVAKLHQKRYAGPNPGVAYLLWMLMFLGVAGAHRFYTGRWVTGLIWVFTGGLLLVGQLIDLALIPGQCQRPKW